MGYNENSTINYPVLFVDFFMIYAYNKDKINQWRCILWRLRQIFYKVLFLFRNSIKVRQRRYSIDFILKKDYFLLLEANKRIEDNGNNETISFDSVMKNLGISEDELLDTEGVDLE